ncbi:MAG: amidohydrolase [Colwellia sp.]
MKQRKYLSFLVFIAVLFGCEQASKNQQKPFVEINKNPYPSTYQPIESERTLIKDITLLMGNGERLNHAYVLFEQGIIIAIGDSVNEPSLPQNTKIIEGKNKWLTPGIIDVHSHLGIFPKPYVKGNNDGNEKVNPISPHVWGEHSVWPQDPAFNTARAGGITTLQTLPGSANLFGGRGVTLKNVPAVTVQAMKFPQAPYGLKMACGENPKGVYGSRNEAPYTRMGNMAGFRQAWINAKEYKAAWDQYSVDYHAGLMVNAPKQDLGLDTLKAVLEGEILIHNHCYKAEEMAMMIDMSKEFDYHAGTFHHATEAYKMPEILAKNGLCVAMWPDWWGAKMESYDMIFENAAIVDAVEGACAIIHSDSSTVIQRLNQEAGKVMYRANEHGFSLKPKDVIKWITLNPAKSMGIDKFTGSIKKGKAADLVLWNQNPFSVFAHAEQVFIDGAKVYDRFDKAYQAKSDFLLGQK